MAEADGGAVVAGELARQGTTHLFTVNGGHIFPILAHLRDNGIQMVHLRHEQTAAYAADGYARTSAKPGVLAVTAGCGFTNAVTGLCQAALTDSAVVCLSGQHAAAEDGTGAFQEAYATEIASSFAKSGKRVLDWSTIGRDVRAAFRSATAPPCGVAVVEIPVDVLHRTGQSERQARGEDAEGEWPPRSSAAAAAVERAAALLADASRPLIVAGDGAFWSPGAAAAIASLAEGARIPLYARRAGQGALSEDDPLAVRGVFKKEVTRNADVVVTFGFKFWSGEHFGGPRSWNPEAKVIQVDGAAKRIGWHVPAAVALHGDPGLVAAQLERALGGGNGSRPAVQGPDEWLERIASLRSSHEESLAAQLAEHREDAPTHPHRLFAELADVLDDDATIVTDSFTLSGYVSAWCQARFPGQMLDAGPLGPVGHGVGMAIGAQLARPGKQIVVLSGDGGLGIGGMDLESAARYGLPIVVVLWNNSSWGPGFELMPLLKGRTDPFDITEGIRYDEVFAPMGVHGENVEGPGELRGALERALASGKPSLLNVVGSKSVGHPTLGGDLLGSSGKSG